MLKIGLTGGIASGKTTVANLFIELGAQLIDTDHVAREVVMPDTVCYQAIINRYGDTICDNDGSLNRAKIRTIIFNDPLEKSWLEQLLHPAIWQRTKLQIETLSMSQLSCPYFLIAVPLLFETHLDRKMDRNLLVDAPVEQQLARAIIRDKSSTEAEIQAIIVSQLPREMRQQRATDIILNDSDISHLKQQVTRLDMQYRLLGEQFGP